MQTKSAKYSGGMAALIFGIIFVVYNAILFIIAGFEHGASFWISYTFMIVAFASVAVSSFLLSRKSVQPRDWLFGYPILSKGFIYLIAQFVVSTIFMLLDEIDCPWEIPLIIDIIVLTVYLVYVIGAFMAKQTIEAVQENVKIKTSYMKMLQADVEMMAMRAADPTVKQAYAKLGEAIRYSDPMSNEALAVVEGQMSAMAAQANNFILTGNNEAALQMCEQLNLLLVERNKKCMILK